MTDTVQTIPWRERCLRLLLQGLDKPSTPTLADLKRVDPLFLVLTAAMGKRIGQRRSYGPRAHIAKDLSIYTTLIDGEGNTHIAFKLPFKADQLSKELAELAKGAHMTTEEAAELGALVRSWIYTDATAGVGQ